MPTHKSITNFWKMKVNEEDIGTYWLQAETHCWRCGNNSPLEKCHIVPKSRGGLNVDSNLILLCQKCHREAPNHTNPEYMWLWIKTTSNKFGDFWLTKAKEEYRRMFREELWFGIDISKKENIELIEKLVADEVKETTHHHGEGLLNSSTEAVVYYEVKKKFEKLVK